MRQIILDTETTGLDHRQGNRILEIGCVELVNRRLTGNNLHFYINPERPSEEGALRVHGLTEAFLSDKPKFAEIAETLRAYLANTEIIIHNAPFDVGFLDAEFERLGWPRLQHHVERILDTLLMAKELHPGKRNSLDALCDRYSISNQQRKLHGALLDAELLAEVYMAMTRGQNALVIEEEENNTPTQQQVQQGTALFSKNLLLLCANTQENAEHQQWLAGLETEIKGPSVWRKVTSAPTQPTKQNDNSPNL